MPTLALVFPGQGAQAVGMGKSLAEASPEARAVLAAADAALGFPLTRVCFEGPIEELTRTEVSQPALYAVAVAALRALEARLGGPLDAACAAGLSLGEYTALTAAGALPFEDGIRLVRRRGELMQAACDAHPSGMASLLGVGPDVCEQACAKARADGPGVVVVANINSPQQTVIAGDHAALERAMAIAKQLGARRAVPLTVAGAFHSPLMQSAADGLRDAVATAALRPARFPVVSNAWAKPVQQPDEIRKALVEQLTSPVRWVQGSAAMHALGARRFLELGTGTVCAGLLKKCLDGVATASCGEASELDGAIAFVRADS
jgi:[acyl-carrier-protein] S-malonyltransferase